MILMKHEWNHASLLSSRFNHSLKQGREGYAHVCATHIMMPRGLAVLTPAIARPLNLTNVRPPIHYVVHASAAYLQKGI